MELQGQAVKPRVNDKVGNFLYIIAWPSLSDLSLLCYNFISQRIGRRSGFKGVANSADTGLSLI